ncbi:MAG: menaquinone biosynthesis protein [Parachlamydiales bacterium]|nr:menaquinone biosynthesis protein [Parachlamydiales bacterium]
MGQIQYVNTLPIFGGFLEKAVASDAQFVMATPTRLNRLLREKSLDLSMISSVEYLSKQDEYIPFAHLGIASKDELQSVCLYTKLPINQLNHKKIAVTGESATSVKLLQILCKHFWKISPIFTPLDEKGMQGDAFLLIGDRCLSHQNIDGYQRIDLSHVWYEATKLPFVFALFVLRKEIIKEKENEIMKFQDEVLKSLAWSESNIDTIIARAHQQTQLTTELLSLYYSRVINRITDEEIVGLEHFSELCGFQLHREQFHFSYQNT